MKQLDLFGDCSEAEGQRSKDGATWRLFIDGAARNNPGPAGAGVYLCRDDKDVVKKGFYLGAKTNNQAEYLALLLGVFCAQEHLAPGDMLYIMSDSQLLVRQLQGVYKIKNPELKKLYNVAVHLLLAFGYSFCHVPRENNTIADALANEGIDRKGKVPPAFRALLEQHAVTL